MPLGGRAVRPGYVLCLLGRDKVDAAASRVFGERRSGREEGTVKWITTAECLDSLFLS